MAAFGAPGFPLGFGVPSPPGPPAAAAAAPPPAAAPPAAAPPPPPPPAAAAAPPPPAAARAAAAAPPPPPAAAPAGGPAGGPRDFNMGAVLAAIAPAPQFAVPGYELPWENYNTLLRENLTAEYPAPAARVPPPPPPAAAAVPGGDPVAAELVRIKAYLNDVAQPGRRPPGFDVGRVNNLVNRARDSPDVAALGRAALFDVNAYRAAVLAFLNANAPAGFNFAGVGP
jgi:hypothetical protein